MWGLVKLTSTQQSRVCDDLYQYSCQFHNYYHLRRKKRKSHDKEASDKGKEGQVQGGSNNIPFLQVFLDQTNIISVNGSNCMLLMRVYHIKNYAFLYSATDGCPS